MAETILLDPAAVATARTEFDITPFIKVDGVDWGDAAIIQVIADGQFGGDPVDFQVPNRQVKLPLSLQARGTVTFEQARRKFQAKTALFQREGGYLSRVTSAGTLFADVVNASLRLGGDWLQANKSADVNAELSLELKPDWYGAEITLDDKTETTLPVLTTVLKQSAADAVIAGDYPTRVRVVVDEDDGDSQLGLLWGFRSRYYDSASTAALFYQAETLTPLDTAAAAALTGASGGTVVRHNSLATTWTPVLSTQMLAGTAHLTHRGTYRAWARCYTTSGTPPDVRFLYDVGDLAMPAENTAQTIPGASNFYQIDLGEIRLDPSPVGTHRWLGQIQAKGAVTGDNVSIDTLMFQPVDDGAGRLAASLASSAAFTGYAARDDFTGGTAAAALNGRVASLGGTWVTSGDATDYAAADLPLATDETMTRSVGSGTNGRYAILGSATPTDVQVETAVYNSDLPNSVGTSMDIGVIARWTDASNYLRATFIRTFSGGSPTFTKTLEIRQVVAGVQTVLATGTVPQSATSNTWYVVRLTVYSNGRAIAELLSAGGVSVLASAEATTAVLATGGALASGKSGLFDRLTDTEVRPRYYDDFAVISVPTPDAVLYSNQAAQLTTDGAFREDITGIAYGPCASNVGNLPRLPPSGLENRKVELFLKGSRGDFNQGADSGIDDISAQVFYRPSWLTAPGS